MVSCEKVRARWRGTGSQRALRGARVVEEVVLVVRVPSGGRRGILQPKISMTKAGVYSISRTTCRICMKNDHFWGGLSCRYHSV